jgi:SnoaL-like polyketide cyclase
MSTFIICRLTYILWSIPPGNRHGSLIEAEARAAIAPWYSLFNFASRGDVRAIQEQILTEDCESCAGYLPGECWGRETSIEVVANFANTIPDMKFDIREMLVAENRVIVRGEVTGTPSGAGLRDWPREQQLEKVVRPRVGLSAALLWRRAAANKPR